MEGFNSKSDQKNPHHPDTQKHKWWKQGKEAKEKYRETKTDNKEV